MRTVTNEEIEAMAHIIQYTENIGSGFIGDDEAIERVKEAINMIGIDRGIEWSTQVMKKAVVLQSEFHNKEKGQ